MFTEVGQVIGTLEYTSPEQAWFNALDVGRWPKTKQKNQCKPSKCGLQSISQRLTSRSETHYVQFPRGAGSKLRERAPDW
jgi:hypothetical protein